MHPATNEPGRSSLQTSQATVARSQVVATIHPASPHQIVGFSEFKTSSRNWFQDGISWIIGETPASLKRHGAAWNRAPGPAHPLCANGDAHEALSVWDRRQWLPVLKEASASRYGTDLSAGGGDRGEGKRVLSCPGDREGETLAVG